MAISPRAGGSGTLSRLAALPGMNPAVPFMAAGVLLLPVLGAGAVLAGPLLARGNFRAWDVLAVNHLATLGWGTLVAMGALYQLFPAMIGSPSRPDRSVIMQFSLSVAGMVLIVTGFLARRNPLIVAGGMLSVAGVTVFIRLVLRALPARRRWTLPASGAMLALVYLALTMVWGLVLAINRHDHLWPWLFTYAGVGTHASLGLVGWFAQIVISESYYLLPRFMGAREMGDGRLRAVLWLLNAAVVLLVIGALGNASAVARAGVVLLSAAGAVYAADLWRFLQGTRGAKPDLTTQHWWVIWAETLLLAAAGLAWALKALPIEGRHLAVAAGTLMLLGWMTLAIMGQLYKITPFLMWFYRYAKGMAPFQIPRLPAPYYPREGVPAFYLTAAAGPLLAATAVVRHPWVGTLGGLCLLAGGLGFWYLMAVSWIRAAAVNTGGPA